MPTPEEIKKIAREYAERVKSEYVSAKLIETLVMGFYHTCLKSDYCIVPKTQVRMAHKMEMQAYESTNKSAAHIFRQRALLLEALFGTALFNEEKE